MNKLIEMPNLFGAFFIVSLVIILICLLVSPNLLKQYLHELELEKEASSKKKEIEDLINKL